MPSLSASVALTPSTVIINQPVNVSVTVVSTSSSAISINSVTPSIILTGGTYNQAANAGVVNLGPNSNMQIAASGTNVYTFSVIFFAPSTGPLGAGVGTYSIGATVLASDGEILYPTAATVTVNPIALPAAEQ